MLKKEQIMQKIDWNAHFELGMSHHPAAALYKETGDLEHALMQVSLDWYSHPHLRSVWDRAMAREANGGTLPKASDVEQDEALVQFSNTSSCKSPLD